MKPALALSQLPNPEVPKRTSLLHLHCPKCGLKALTERIGGVNDRKVYRVSCECKSVATVILVTERKEPETA